METPLSGQVMLVSDRCYCIHQPETAIASLQQSVRQRAIALFVVSRVEQREALAIPQGIASLAVGVDDAKIAGKYNLNKLQDW